MAGRRKIATTDIFGREAPAREEIVRNPPFATCSRVH
jgi:hypothetical protein